MCASFVAGQRPRQTELHRLAVEYHAIAPQPFGRQQGGIGTHDEVCGRARVLPRLAACQTHADGAADVGFWRGDCLLYTSDAADDLYTV